jgi:fructokinase
VDLGGTKVEIIALAATGKILARKRVSAPQNDYGATLDCIARLVRETETKLGGRGSVGVGIPGSVSPATGLVRNANSTWLNGQPLERDLARQLDRPLRVANDANCFALSEAVDGAAAGAPVVFGVILGTGVGGGIVVSGDVLVGANAIAGEWGHTPLADGEHADDPAPPCWCGRRGCIETYLSGPALARSYRAAAGITTTAEDVCARAEQGEAAAITILERYSATLARALATVINIIDPHVIVLGGGISNIGALYRQVPRHWRAHVFSDRVVTRLAKNRHGDSSGVRGAAWLWPARSVRA